MTHILKYEQVGAKIIELRDQKVITDSDVAELYGVEEWESLKPKFSTSMKGGK